LKVYWAAQGLLIALLFLTVSADDLTELVSQTEVNS
jgi:hypothetical protein